MYSRKEYLIHGLLFVLTIGATTLAGGEWLYGKSLLGNEEYALDWEYFLKSMHFSIPFIGILFIHEMGHLFTSIHHKVKSSLPYFIPAWLGFLGAPSIGTFGAIIQMKSFINSRKKFFDIGVAGPLAGFVIAFGVLWYGFTNLPDADYIYEIHPEYLDPDFKGHSAEEGYINLRMGYNLLFFGMEKLLADPEKMPNMSEIIHFPIPFCRLSGPVFYCIEFTADWPIGRRTCGFWSVSKTPQDHFPFCIHSFYILCRFGCNQSFS
jgi:membrane-associated protease RseP (regulator of RpoE activity)